MTPDATIVISTYNRAAALPPTLEALAQQDVQPDRYEVIVVDDGSSDDTQTVLREMHVPYDLRIFRQPVNRGVSAGRNIGMREARGMYLILLSDDLVVSKDFVRLHLGSLERYPDAWVVGGFSQLEDLRATPFGRYLDALERSFDSARLGRRLDDHTWEMGLPTARNLSLRRADLDRIGLFDEQFRVTCEDQDLGQRATAVGIRFLYNDEIRCVHNDHAANLQRYCRFQERGAIDTVRLVRKRPDLHGGAPVVAVNGPVSADDSPVLIAKKAIKRLLSLPLLHHALVRAIAIAERRGLPDAVLFRLYTGMIALATFRGWRAGLEQEGGIPPH